MQIAMPFVTSFWSGSKLLGDVPSDSMIPNVFFWSYNHFLRTVYHMGFLPYFRLPHSNSYAGYGERSGGQCSIV